MLIAPRSFWGIETALDKIVYGKLPHTFRIKHIVYENGAV